MVPLVVGKPQELLTPIGCPQIGGRWQGLVHVGHVCLLQISLRSQTGLGRSSAGKRSHIPIGQCEAARAVLLEENRETLGVSNTYRHQQRGQ